MSQEKSLYLFIGSPDIGVDPWGIQQNRSMHWPALGSRITELAQSEVTDMDTPAGTIAVMPYLTLDKACTIGGCQFLPLREAIRSGQIGKDRAALRKTLQVYRDGKLPVIDPITIPLPNREVADRFSDALLAFKFSFTVPRTVTRLYDDHFEVAFHRMGTKKSESIALEEGLHVTFGRARDLRRAMPGPLHPERILAQWFPIVGTQTLAEVLAERMGQPGFVGLQRGLQWFCKSFRWRNDSSDNVIALVVALEVLFDLPKHHKYESLAKHLCEISNLDSETLHWVEAVYDLRNTILHDGGAAPAAYIYRDTAGNPVRYHEDVARAFLVEVIKGRVSQATAPRESLVSLIIKHLQGSKFRRLLRSNKTRLEALLDMLDRPLSFETILGARDLSDLDAQDFSLNAEDCRYFTEAVKVRTDELRVEVELQDELMKLRRNLHRTIEVLEFLRTNLECGVFRLPDPLP